MAGVDGLVPQKGIDAAGVREAPNMVGHDVGPALSTRQKPASNPAGAGSHHHGQLHGWAERERVRLFVPGAHEAVLSPCPGT